MQGAEGGGLLHDIQLAEVNHILVKINVTAEETTAATETERQGTVVKGVFVQPCSKRPSIEKSP